MVLFNPAVYGYISKCGCCPQSLKSHQEELLGHRFWFVAKKFVNSGSYQKGITAVIEKLSSFAKIHFLDIESITIELPVTASVRYLYSAKTVGNLSTFSVCFPPELTSCWCVCSDWLFLIFQRSIVSCPRSKCRTDVRTTCLQATTWFPFTSLQPPKTNQRCSAVRIYRIAGSFLKGCVYSPGPRFKYICNSCGYFPVFSYCLFLLHFSMS